MSHVTSVSHLLMMCQVMWERFGGILSILLMDFLGFVANAFITGLFYSPKALTLCVALYVFGVCGWWELLHQLWTFFLQTARKHAWFVPYRCLKIEVQPAPFALNADMHGCGKLYEHCVGDWWQNRVRRKVHRRWKLDLAKGGRQYTTLLTEIRTIGVIHTVVEAIQVWWQAEIIKTRYSKNL